MNTFNKELRIIQIREDRKQSIYECPNCKELAIFDLYNYCPKCGYQINWIVKEYGNE